ncbi:MAG: AmmeMemoRadiSam system protein B [Thermoplasmata archaeon]
MPTTRPPAVAGAFYPADGAALAELVEACFRDRVRGPGGLPAHRRTGARRIRAIVVPHAGLVYSGAIAACAYRYVAEEPAFPTVLILGVDHHGWGGFALSRRPWATPLGPTEVDEALVDRLDRAPLEVDEAAHELEHSIEVQLPFLEYVEPKPRMVALQVAMAPLRELREVGERVAEAIRGRDVLLVASTDFSHYVAPEVAAAEDRFALDAIVRGDPAGLYEVVERRRISMCGIAPTTVLLAALAGEPNSVRLRKYGHSGEVAPMARVVGYGALTVERTDAGRPPLK